jgi:hypothetical protein
MNYRELHTSGIELALANAEITRQNVTYQNLLDKHMSGIQRQGQIAELQTEQSQSMSHRAAVAETINYGDVFMEWDALYALRDAISERTTDESEARIKANTLRSIAMLETSLEVACTAWTIPQVIVSPDETHQTRTGKTLTPSNPRRTRREASDLSLPHRSTELATLVNHVFTYAQRAGQTGFTLKELRQDVPAIEALSDKDYVFFRNYFSKIRQQITETIETIGYTASWQKSGTKSNMRHILHTTLPVDSEPDTDPPVSP